MWGRSEAGTGQHGPEEGQAAPLWSDSPPHRDASCLRCLQDLVKPLQTFIYGAVDVLLGEKLGGSSKDAHFLGSSSHLPTARGIPVSIFLFKEPRVTKPL